MAEFELRLPKMGESVAEATLIKWNKKVGDNINVDDVVVEIATDKVDSEVQSPIKGTLIKTFFKENDIAKVGDVLAIINTDAHTTVKEPLTNNVSRNISPNNHQPTVVTVNENKTASTEKRFYSPLVKSIALKENISLDELDNIVGTGMEGRLTKEDLLNYILNKQQPKSTPIEIQQQIVLNQEGNSDEILFDESQGEIIEMDRMRKIIAEHMVNSKKIAPHVTSFIEVDVTNLVEWREKIKQSFEKRENQKITFTPVFIEVVARALREYPMINISVKGNQIIKKKDINIGIATALPSGNLIVPVVHNADQLNLMGMVKKVNLLADKARKNKLSHNEITGGTFTISNIGTFGNILGTPIINQPEVAILATGAIKKKPAVLSTEYGDVIAIRHLMYLSLSYDHRVVDGFLGGSFLKRIGDLLELWDVNTEL